MPRLSLFYGIAIYIYYRDHAPPHFHAIYGEHEAVIDLGSLSIVEGALPRRAKRLVTDWAAAHVDQLIRNWELAASSLPLEPIEPLD